MQVIHDENVKEPKFVSILFIFFTIAFFSCQTQDISYFAQHDTLSTDVVEIPPSLQDAKSNICVLIKAAGYERMKVKLYLAHHTTLREHNSKESV